MSVVFLSHCKMVPEQWIFYGALHIWSSQHRLPNSGLCSVRSQIDRVQKHQTQHFIVYPKIISLKLSTAKEIARKLANMQNSHWPRNSGLVGLGYRAIHV
jgi:hypothetical protein